MQKSIDEVHAMKAKRAQSERKDAIPMSLFKKVEESALPKLEKAKSMVIDMKVQVDAMELQDIW